MYIFYPRNVFGKAFILYLKNKFPQAICIGENDHFHADDYKFEKDQPIIILELLFFGTFNNELVITYDDRFSQRNTCLMKRTENMFDKLNELYKIGPVDPLFRLIGDLYCNRFNKYDDIKHFRNGQITNVYPNRVVMLDLLGRINKTIDDPTELLVLKDKVYFKSLYDNQVKRTRKKLCHYRELYCQVKPQQYDRNINVYAVMKSENQVDLAMFLSYHKNVDLACVYHKDGDNYQAVWFSKKEDELTSRFNDLRNVTCIKCMLPKCSEPRNLYRPVYTELPSFLQERKYIRYSMQALIFLVGSYFGYKLLSRFWNYI